MESEDVLFFDTEFTNSKRLCHCAVVDITGKPLLNAVIDYNLSLEELLEEEYRATPEGLPYARIMNNGTIRKFYGEVRADVAAIPRLTPVELAQAIADLCIQSKWLIEYSITGHLDYDIICQCLAQYAPQFSNAILPPVQRVLSLYPILRQMAHGIVPLTLPVVYIAIFGLNNALSREHHLADIDSIKLARVFDFIKIANVQRPTRLITSYFQSSTSSSSVAEVSSDPASAVLSHSASTTSRIRTASGTRSISSFFQPQDARSSFESVAVSSFGSGPGALQASLHEHGPDHGQGFTQGRGSARGRGLMSRRGPTRGRGLTRGRGHRQGRGSVRGQPPDPMQDITRYLI